MNQIIVTMMEVKDLIQIYHWQTKDYARHKAAGELYDKLNIHLDKFVEAYQDNKRFNVGRGRIDIKNMSGGEAEKMLEKFADFLIKISKTLRGNPDLLNIRDEILADVNQTLYLFSLK